MALVLEIKLVKSTIGHPKRQERTVRALGLRSIGQVVSHRDTPAVRGMLRVVQHLVEVKERPETPEERAKRIERTQTPARKTEPVPAAAKATRTPAPTSGAEAPAEKATPKTKKAAQDKGGEAAEAPKSAKAKATKKEAAAPGDAAAKKQPAAKRSASGAAVGAKAEKKPAKGKGTAE